MGIKKKVVNEWRNIPIFMIPGSERKTVNPELGLSLMNFEISYSHDPFEKVFFDQQHFSRLFGTLQRKEQNLSNSSETNNWSLRGGC